MATVKLNNGLVMPMVGLGTYLIKDGQVCKDVVKEALKVGYRLIDTATVYKNEEFIGDVISREEFLSSLNLRREDIFITTKVAPGDQGSGKCRDGVLLSLSKLQLEYIDLVLIHWPGASGVDHADEKNFKLRSESWADLEQLVKEGKIKSIGVSNYTIKHLEELLSSCTIKPVVNQVEFHPYLYQKELLEFCKSKDIVLQGYSSLGSSKGVDSVLGDPMLQAIAEAKDPYDIKPVTVAQVALKWSLQLGVPVIPKTCNLKRLAENFDFSFKLTDSEMDKICGLNQDKRYCWDPNTIC